MHVTRRTQVLEIVVVFQKWQALNIVHLCVVIVIIIAFKTKFNRLQILAETYFFLLILVPIWSKKMRFFRPTRKLTWWIRFIGNFETWGITLVFIHLYFSKHVVLLAHIPCIFFWVICDCTWYCLKLYRCRVWQGCWGLTSSYSESRPEKTWR